MVKKKYNYFETGDLVKFKIGMQGFQRGPNGTKINRDTTIYRGETVIYLGAKVPPTSTRHWEQKRGDGKKRAADDYDHVRWVSIKMMWEGAIWYISCSKESVYDFLKLVQKVHK